MNSDRTNKLFSPVKKIRLLADLPIDLAHGAFVGREFAVAETPPWDRRSGRIWFQARDGVRCSCWPSECRPMPIEKAVEEVLPE
jgi:hypothetical protein